MLSMRAIELAVVLEWSMSIVGACLPALPSTVSEAETDLIIIINYN